jgi:hypothetical protein
LNPFSLQKKKKLLELKTPGDAVLERIVEVEKIVEVPVEKII